MEVIVGVPGFGNKTTEHRVFVLFERIFFKALVHQLAFQSLTPVVHLDIFFLFKDVCLEIPLAVPVLHLKLILPAGANSGVHDISPI